MNNLKNTKDFETQKAIELRSDVLAEKKSKEMFEKWKKEFLVSFNLDQSFEPDLKLKNSKTKTKQLYTKQMIKKLESSSRIKQVYNVISQVGRADRHQIQEKIQLITSSTISQGSIAGRIGDLLYSGLIVESGTHIGKFGKRVTMYSIATGV